MMEWTQMIIAYALGVASSISAQFLWQRSISPTWDKDISRDPMAFWEKRGYFKDASQSNQWVHKKRGPLANIKQVSTENIPYQLSRGYRYVRTNILRKKTHTWSGNPPYKEYFLEPDPKVFTGLK